ncbi:MAG: DUF559 domain-containing protein [Nanoarchaeota archaeon]|nr:DUF559 domain-containing protein [Nanoarchaeota archaeon]
MKNKKDDKLVLVGVLKQKRDLALLLRERWYRIPLRCAPKRKFEYLAFYEPARFGKDGKCIRYYAKIRERCTFLRRDILPHEFLHPRASEKYLWFRVGRIQALARPIKNIVPRRVSFCFTTLRALLNSRIMLQLYNVVSTEEIVARALKRANITARPQHYVAGEKKRYCLDFAVCCKRGTIAIECDNLKAHSSSRQHAKDKAKDAFLRRHGWEIIRLTEAEILSDLKGCIVRVKQLVRKYGGIRADKP